ncbi:hypothetical protein [Amycolatopsis sp. NPDC058986]|uniref:hypothetical protein n=1 Tax=unclassified Amycolatopsis TaxID=2618356 RepID=UPI003672920D
MTEKEYKTETGALLNALEHQRIAPGHWIVEGHEVRRDGRKWTFRRLGRIGEPVILGSFTAVLAAIDAL